MADIALGRKQFLAVFGGAAAFLASLASAAAFLYTSEHIEAFLLARDASAARRSRPAT